MPFRDTARIAGSAMRAQSVRLHTVASNLANVDSVAGSADSAFRARKPVFAAVYVGAGLAADWPSPGVQVLDVITVDAPPREAHEPGNPLADADGKVYYPNVNPVEEMTDMMSASRAFQTNAEVLISLKAMRRDLLELGEG